LKRNFGREWRGWASSIATDSIFVFESDIEWCEWSNIETETRCRFLSYRRTSIFLFGLLDIVGGGFGHERWRRILRNGALLTPRDGGISIENSPLSV
jgi:hypothetical protein